MKQKSVSAAIEVRTIWHNIHPSRNAWSSSVPLSHHNFTDYPEQNNPETVLKISLHRACEDLHTQPLLPNGAVFQLFRWKISYCGSLWGKCPTCLLLLLMVVVLLYDLLFCCYWTAVDLPVAHAACGCGHCGSTDICWNHTNARVLYSEMFSTNFRNLFFCIHLHIFTSFDSCN